MRCCCCGGSGQVNSDDDEGECTYCSGTGTEPGSVDNNEEEEEWTGGGARNRPIIFSCMVFILKYETKI